MTTLTNLKQLPQWVAYSTDKVPINPHTGGAASSADPQTWGTAAQAWSRKSRQGLAGIGFVFTKQSGIVGLDLDNCYDGDDLKPYALEVVQCLSSYTERSPSGRGLHILVRGEIPHSLKTKEVEIYDELRYFTVTGDALAAYNGPIESCPDALMALWVTFGGDLNERPLPDVRDDVKLEWSENDIAGMLAKLPPQGSYNEDWLPVLMAVHSYFPDERGVRLIEQWSPGYPGEVRRKWRSFSNTARDGVGIGTLVHKAKLNGWQSPYSRPENRPGRRTSHKHIDDTMRQEAQRLGLT